MRRKLTGAAWTAQKTDQTQSVSGHDGINALRDSAWSIAEELGHGAQWRILAFDDGNGRIARIMMNAELVAAGEVRIIVPIVYRANYPAVTDGPRPPINNGSR